VFPAASEDKAMTSTDTATGTALARVTYRATVGGGREAAIHIVVPPDAATVADAWRRFSAMFAEVDPMSLEVEVRPFPPPAAEARLPSLRRLAAVLGAA
jgi:hypothetical protein